MNQCPKCSVRLKDTATDGVLYSICPECSAVWVAEMELQGLIRRRLARRQIDVVPHLHVETDPRGTELSCPDCAAESLEVIRLRGVEVERCPGCKGIFFDPTELSHYTVRTVRSAEELKRMRSEPQVPVTPKSDLTAVGIAADALLEGLGFLACLVDW